jgi:hypothetical protein
VVDKRENPFVVKKRVRKLQELFLGKFFWGMGFSDLGFSSVVR